MNFGNFEIRKAERKAHCRVCDVELVPKVDDIFYTSTFRNRGQNILICIPCMERAATAIIKYKKDNENHS